MHSPGFNVKSLGTPAELIPITFKEAGCSCEAPTVSIDRTANPSMAELSNLGNGKVASRLWLIIRPLDSLIRTTSESN